MKGMRWALLGLLVTVGAGIVALPTSILPGQPALQVLGWSLKHPWQPLLPAVKLQTNEADFRTLAVYGGKTSELAVWMHQGTIVLNALYYRHSNRELRFTTQFPDALNAIQTAFGTDVVQDFATAQVVLQPAQTPETIIFRGDRFGYLVSYYSDPDGEGYLGHFQMMSLAVLECSFAQWQTVPEIYGVDHRCFNP